MNKLGTTITIFLISAIGMAQSPIDIGLFNDGNNNLEVRIKPSSNFDGVFSSIVFTVRWDAATGVSLGELTQEMSVGQYLPVQYSGSVEQDGYFNYQVFAGIGMISMSSVNQQLNANQEVVIATIPVTGSANFEIVNDDWTEEIHNNGDYYIALGGLDNTGVIYSSATGIDEDNAGHQVSVQPNPNNGQFVVSFLTDAMDDHLIEVVNTMGQTVYREQLSGSMFSFRKQLDLSEHGSGVYYLNVAGTVKSSTHKIIIR